MRACLGDSAFLHHEDTVRIGDGGEPVGYDERRAPLGERVRRAADLAFRCRVQRRGRLVQDQDRRAPQEQPRLAEHIAPGPPGQRILQHCVLDRADAVAAEADALTRLQHRRRGAVLAPGRDLDPAMFPA